jgi:hypothetical protein
MVILPWLLRPEHRFWGEQSDFNGLPTVTSSNVETFICRRPAVVPFTFLIVVIKIIF